MTERRMIGPTKFEEYSEKYKEFLLMTRRAGIIEVRLHTDGGRTSILGKPIRHGPMHGQMFTATLRTR